MRLVLVILLLGFGPLALAETATEGEYEIDSEEEAEVEAVPAPQSPGRAARPQKGGSGVQGSRAKDRFVPILKSETRSIYKKNGKHYDVDTD